MARKQLGVAPSGATDTARKGDVPGIVVQGFTLGTGAPGPYTLTHNFGTAEVFGYARDNVTQETIVVEFLPGPSRLTQTIVNTPDTWLANSVHVTLMGVIGTSDVVSPTQPTIAFVSKTDTTISVSTSSATDANGIRGYDYYLGTTKVAALQGSTYTYTGLAPSTPYANLNVVAVDNEGNPSAASANLASVTTNATPAATKQATGTGGRNATAATTITQTATVTVPASLTNSVLLFPVVTSHANWLDMSAASGAGSITASSNNGGAIAKVASSIQFQGNAGQQTGWVVWFALTTPNAGAHTITVTATSPSAGAVEALIVGAPLVYSGVASIGTPVKQNSATANAAVNASVPSQVGDIVLAAVGAASAVTGLSGTNVSNAGAAVNGTCDFGYLQEVAGAATSVTVSSSSSAHAVAVSAIDLVKA